MLWDQYKKVAVREPVSPGPGGWWYHHAPTQERDRIQQHGLQAANPNDNGWGVEDQPNGVYLVNSPEALKNTLFRKPKPPTNEFEPAQPHRLDTWRVPADQVKDVHADPRIWDKSVYTPHPIPNPKLYRPYEKSNEYANQFDPGHELPGLGPRPEDWVAYHDWHELGNPSDEEWASYGIGQDPETWGKQSYWKVAAARPPDAPYYGGSGNFPYEKLDNPWRDTRNYVAATSPKPWEAKMFHGKPNGRGILGPIRTPFWTTSHEPEALGFAGGEGFEGNVHPVSVRFQRPAHFFAGVNWDHQSLELARQLGHDGAVVHYPEDDPNTVDPWPARTWAIALDPGAVVPGHLKDSVTD